jgi:hypothetical protein
MSGFYETNNLPNFTISRQPIVITPSNLNNYINPVIIYASFELTSGGEFRIHPINMKAEYGQFQVTAPSTSMEIQFVGNPEVVSKVLGTISFNYDYSVESVSDTTFQYNLSNLPSPVPTPVPYFGTISLQLLLKK